jgi:4-hydroxyphenylacetate 3-monooxygenase
MATTTDRREGLLTGAEYRESLRDSREVYYRGERIDDVLSHPATGPGIEWHARLYDAQHDPATRDVLTFATEGGERRSTVWLVPRTQEDLERKRLCTEWIAWETMATIGRTPDMLPWNPIGQLAFVDEFRKLDPLRVDNLTRLFEDSARRNIHLAGVLIEPQGVRARSARAGDNRGGVMRVVREDEGGITIVGAKAVGTYAPQAHELVVGSIYYPYVRPEEAFWCYVPIGSRGLRLVCREIVTEPGAPPFDHPVTSRGEEADCFVIFDEVFVPWERVYSYGAPEACNPLLYGLTGGGEQWQLLTHLAVKAELLAGVTQLVIEVLDIADIPAIRDLAGRVFEYAQLLRNGVIAGQARAAMTPGAILLPDAATVAAARAYGLEHYPQIVRIVQELCGQGLVMRFSERDFDNPLLAEKLALYLDATTMTAREKNRLMNAVWDLTTSAAAGRTALFENVNGLPASFLRQRLFGVYDRSAFTARVRELVGLPA